MFQRIKIKVWDISFQTREPLLFTILPIPNLCSSSTVQCQCLSDNVDISSFTKFLSLSLRIGKNVDANCNYLNRKMIHWYLLRVYLDKAWLVQLIFLYKMFNLLSYIFEIAHVFEGFDHYSLHMYIKVQWFWIFFTFL